MLPFLTPPVLWLDKPPSWTVGRTNEPLTGYSIAGRWAAWGRRGTLRGEIRARNLITLPLERPLLARTCTATPRRAAASRRLKLRSMLFYSQLCTMTPGARRLAAPRRHPGVLQLLFHLNAKPVGLI